jgi:hypothetical protein
MECSLCHGTSGWRPAKISNRFDHSTYGFRLEGAHAKAECIFCHDNLRFAGASSECAQCHQDVHQGEFGVDCARCHQTRSFIDRPAQVGMHRTTRFPLTGSHASLDCDLCHAGGEQAGASFVNTPSACSACHMDDYRATRSPDHAGGGFSQDCTECHNTVAWAGGAYRGDHAFFPLKGGHGSLECGTCHIANRYSGMDPSCWTCHETDYASTTSPNHTGSRFPTECNSCHDIQGWDGARFDHGLTSFALNGAHGSLECAQCHGNDGFSGLNGDCVACHRQDYDATVDPRHAASGFSTDCTTCHGTTSWLGANFDHDSFPLTAGHGGLDCASCHANGVYTGLSSACVTCHRQDYDATVDPRHAASGFSTDCTTCHGTTSWLGANFDHTTFPLTGAHRSLDCLLCHGDGVYAGRDATCHACHQQDYANTTNPNHTAAGYSTDCTQCHDTSSFSGATFSHTSFALTGGHGGLDCAACHGNGVYSGLPSDCVFCHQDDFNATTNPRHGTAGFGTDCASCHGTTTWNGATFDHDASFFPIYSSKHRGKWNDCSDCHVNQSNYSAFSCLNCHAHDRSRTDEDHSGVSGYRYDSFACLDCHPRGD